MFEHVALILAFTAGACTALGNLVMRRAMDASGGQANSYLFVQIFISALLAIWLQPVKNHAYTLDMSTALLGVLAGISLSGVMFFLGRSLARGPAGLTIAFINASTVVPAILMFFIFGPSFGFVFDNLHWIGTCMIVIGLFWASTTTLKIKDIWGWARAVGLVFAFHIALLVIMQYRALILRVDLPRDPVLLPFHGREADSFWFVPIMFIVAWIIQSAILFKSPSKLSPKIISYGALGGITTAFSSTLLAMSAVYAHQFECTLIYPLYSVSIVLICSLWSLWLYKERVNWPAIILASSGIVLGVLGKS